MTIGIYQCIFVLKYLVYTNLIFQDEYWPMKITENRKNYLWVAEQLRNTINNKEWLSSEKIPSERTLSQEFGVARVTIRRALRVLESENRIRRMQGSGTYVNPGRSYRIPLMIDYTGSMNTYAPDLKRELVHKELITASEYVAANLKIKQGSSVLYAERIDFNDEATVAYDKAYIPEYYTRNLTDDILAKVNFLEMWSQSGHFDIAHCKQYIEAISATDSCQKYLKLTPGAPVLKSTEYYYVTNNGIAGMFISYYNPEHILISSRYDWKEKIANDNAQKLLSV